MSSKSISWLLEKLGFREGTIVETIVTTLNPNGTVNPAPMGIIRKDSMILEIKPFKTSQTYRNILNNQIACINVITDPSFYLLTAFKDKQFDGFLQPKFNGLRMIQAEAYILLKNVYQKMINDIRGAFYFEVKGIEYKTVNPKAYNRGDSATIDAIIHATRVKAFLHQGKLDDAKEARSHFYLCRDTVNSVTKSTIIDELVRLIDEWSVSL